MPRTLLLAGLAIATPALGADGQAWNLDDALRLVERAVERRASERAGGLDDFRARARGFVFFLAQLGEGLAEPPQLVRSDQLELEVYWNAQGGSKQRIIGWRNRVDLPTDIRYHRDHLGIVQNGFADRIRLGEGDEVRDVPHPLAPDGAALYDFALIDSVEIRLPERSIRTIEVAFRPKDYEAPRIAGSMFLDAAGAELVQLRFNFTRAAYLDPSLEDITVLLENALWEGRWWLPRRQEIEIRRRATWLELPARGIIRGRWEIDGYMFNDGVDAAVFLGPEIVAAPPSARDSFAWREPLDRAIAGASGPVTAVEMGDVRARVRAITDGRFLSGLPTRRPTVGSLSELLHFNRVEGFAPGFGYGMRSRDGAVEVRGWVSYGISDERLKGKVETTWRRGRTDISLRAARVVRDIGDEPVVAPVINSFLAQEFAIDYGDYVLLADAALEVRRRDLAAWIGVERATGIAVRARPATGTFDANPPLGSGTWAVAGVRMTARRQSPSAERRATLRWELTAGARTGARYVRGRLQGEVSLPALGGALTFSARMGWGSGALPPHRAFVLGGRATLVGEPFRAWGGRAAALGRVEWRAPAPFPAIPLGAFASTGRQLDVIPYAAVGWTGQAVPNAPWIESDGPRPVVGVAFEVFHRLLRIDTGWSPRSAAVGITVDLRRDLWPVL